MTMMLTAPPLDDERRELGRMARSSSLPHRTVVQAKAAGVKCTLRRRTDGRARTRC
jgi:hypothetical protein